DLVTSGGVVAVDRVQMLLWTLFGVGAFILGVWHDGTGTITELPAVPERLLYLMGLSATGYLAGKMARKAGPVMAEISVSPADRRGRRDSVGNGGSSTGGARDRRGRRQRGPAGGRRTAAALRGRARCGRDSGRAADERRHQPIQERSCHRDPRHESLARGAVP